MCGRTFGRPPEGGYLPRFKFQQRLALRVSKSLRSSPHDRDLFPARRFNEGPTPTRSTHTTLPQDPQDRKTQRIRKYVPPRPSSHPCFRLLHQLSVRNSSHSHPHPTPSPPQPSSPPCKLPISAYCSFRPADSTHSHSPNLVFLTIGLFPPQIRVTSGSLVVISLPCPSSHGRP